MRDYWEEVKKLRACAANFSCAGCVDKCATTSNEPRTKTALSEAADVIEELIAVCREIAVFVIQYSDEDNVSAEVLCRKLHKIGVVEKDGAWWTLPEPPKEVERWLTF